VKTHSASWFVKEIERRAERFGSDMAMKFDITADKIEATVKAVLDMLPDGWSCIMCEVDHPEAQKRQITRATFLGPEYQRPEPVEVAEVKRKRGEDWPEAFERTRRTLRRKYDWQYHVPKGHKIIAKPERAVVEVWRPADWLQAQYPAFSLVELAGLLRGNVREVRSLGPDATRGRKQVEQCREIAPIGGQATAHYNDAEVTNAFAEFKRRNPRKTAWDAANALIRPGKALSDYKSVTGPCNRIGSIAEKQLGITREEWFEAL
jgi:hypothetical protein